MGYEIITVDTSVGPLGARVSGVDLSRPICASTIAEIKSAWNKHQVLFFQDQALTPQQQADFAANFGVLDVYPFVDAIASNPHVIPIIKEPDAELNFGGVWHTDTSYMERPPSATVLYALEVPDAGGDTLFADASSAFDDLSEGLKQMLSGLTGVYTPGLVHGNEGIYKEVAARSEETQSNTQSAQLAEQEVEHPLIRTHVDTGKKSVYCSPPHTHRIKGWSRAESIPLLRYLMDHCTQDQYVTRFKWQPGFVAMWDNRCTFHNALNDYHGKRRHMHRVIVQGEPPQ